MNGPVFHDSGDSCPIDFNKPVYVDYNGYNVPYTNIDPWNHQYGDPNGPLGPHGSIGWDVHPYPCGPTYPNVA